MEISILQQLIDEFSAATAQALRSATSPAIWSRVPTVPTSEQSSVQLTTTIPLMASTISGCHTRAKTSEFPSEYQDHREYQITEVPKYDRGHSAFSVAFDHSSFVIT